MQENDIKILIESAQNGNKAALEEVLGEVQSLVFNLSLRMLGTITDAEDASQEILIKIMTKLSTFQFKSKFSTWVYKIAINYLYDYRKSMFAKHPLSFDFMAEDINNGFINNDLVDYGNVDESILTDELKMSCTNIMLQCLDSDSRCIYILGTMFKVDSKIAGEILGISPDNYRQKLHRIRKKMSEFLSSYCGLTDTGKCNCTKRIGYAMKSGRLNPAKLEYQDLEKLNNEVLLDCQLQMEKMDELSLVFGDMPVYQSPQSARLFLEKLLHSSTMNNIQQA